MTFDLRCDQHQTVQMWTPEFPLKYTEQGQTGNMGIAEAFPHVSADLCGTVRMMVWFLTISYKKKL